MNDCTIAIPTYYGSQMLLNCVASVMKTVRDPVVIVYKNDIGWLKASNYLMETTKPNDLLLINDDILLLSDCVTEMRKLAYSDPKIGIVGGKSLQANGATINNYGIYIAPDGNTAHRYYGQAKDSVGVEKQKSVEGSMMYIKREVLDTIGYFDEGYGMGYREELDFCFRAREAGYDIYSCPTAEYIHFASSTNAALGIHNDTYPYFMKKWGTKLKLGKI